MKLPFAILASLVLAASAWADVKSPGNSGSSSLPATFVACTGVAASDGALLAAAATTAGSITLTGNCTVAATITLTSHTVLNGNGYSVTGAVNTAWSGSAVSHFFATSGATDVTIQGVHFICPASATGSMHVMHFSGGSQIRVLNNVVDGTSACGDGEAMIGVTDGKVIGNTVNLITNSCYDNWNGTQDVEIADNYCSTIASGTSSVYPILWTGFNTNDSAGTLTTRANIHDNRIFINNQATFGDVGIWLQGYSSCTGAAADHADVHDNEIFIATGIWGQGIRADGCANHGYIHDNVIVSDGTVSTLPAIEAKSTTTDMRIDNNRAYNYSAPTSGTDAGIFNNEATGGASLLNNTCTGTCSAILYSGQATGIAQVPGLTQPYDLYTWGVAAAIMSSATMAANGAYSAATSQPVTAAPGFWGYYPANYICTANAAGVYWTVPSSATAGTIYNVTLASGAPYVPTSPTAFSCSAGSGTQTTSALRALITLPIAGNTMGANGQIYTKTLGARNNNADTVIQEWSFGGTNFALASTVSVNWYGMERTLINTGAANSQLSMGASTAGTDAVLAGNGTATFGVNTANSQNLVLQCQINTATDWCFIYGGKVVIDYAP